MHKRARFATNSVKAYSIYKVSVADLHQSLLFVLPVASDPILGIKLMCEYRIFRNCKLGADVRWMMT